MPGTVRAKMIGLGQVIHCFAVIQIFCQNGCRWSNIDKYSKEKGFQQDLFWFKNFFFHSCIFSLHDVENWNKNHTIFTIIYSFCNQKRFIIVMLFCEKTTINDFSCQTYTEENNHFLLLNCTWIYFRRSFPITINILK